MAMAVVLPTTTSEVSGACTETFDDATTEPAVLALLLAGTPSQAAQVQVQVAHVQAQPLEPLAQSAVETVEAQAEAQAPAQAAGAKTSAAMDWERLAEKRAQPAEATAAQSAGECPPPQPPPWWAHAAVEGQASPLLTPPKQRPDSSHSTQQAPSVRSDLAMIGTGIAAVVDGSGVGGVDRAETVTPAAEAQAAGASVGQAQVQAQVEALRAGLAEAEREAATANASRLAADEKLVVLQADVTEALDDQRSCAMAEVASLQETIQQMEREATNEVASLQLTMQQMERETAALQLAMRQTERNSADEVASLQHTIQRMEREAAARQLASQQREQERASADAGVAAAAAAAALASAQEANSELLASQQQARHLEAQLEASLQQTRQLEAQLAVLQIGCDDAVAGERARIETLEADLKEVQRSAASEERSMTDENTRLLHRLDDSEKRAEASATLAAAVMEELQSALQGKEKELVALQEARRADRAEAAARLEELDQHVTRLQWQREHQQDAARHSPATEQAPGDACRASELIGRAHQSSSGELRGGDQAEAIDRAAGAQAVLTASEVESKIAAAMQKVRAEEAAKAHVDAEAAAARASEERQNLQIAHANVLVEHRREIARLQARAAAAEARAQLAEERALTMETHQGEVSRASAVKSRACALSPMEAEAHEKTGAPPGATVGHHATAEALQPRASPEVAPHSVPERSETSRVTDDLPPVGESDGAFETQMRGLIEQKQEQIELLAGELQRCKLTMRTMWVNTGHSPQAVRRTFAWQ